MILCTFPGRFGDLLWALSTVRAISRHLGDKVDFCTATKYGSIIPLLKLQPYIRYAWADPEWKVEETAPITPWIPPWDDSDLSSGVPVMDVDAKEVFGSSVKYDHILHLAYRAWPSPTCPENTLNIAASYLGEGVKEHYTLEEPWIVAPERPHWMIESDEVAVGFSDEWIELKAGLLLPLAHRLWEEKSWQTRVIFAEDSRWDVEFATPLAEVPSVRVEAARWPEAAAAIANSKVFLGCLSALAVLARGLGKKTVLVEPSEARWNPVFHQGIHRGLVLGSDGKPTFDARIVLKALEEALG